MKIPEGYTLEEVLEIIERIASRLAPKFRFGYYDLDDMKQEAALFAWQGIEKYDGVRPLENFLWIHVRNRLFNLKRNNYARPDKPCDNCPLNAYIDDKCTAYDNMMDCKWYSKWFQRNQTKKALMSTKENKMDSGLDETAVDDLVFSRQIYSLINDNIPINMRADWIRFSNHLKLPKNKREALLNTVLQILKEHGIEPETW